MAYTREVRVFEETDGAEVGEVWFGEDTLERMCELGAEVTAADGAREAAGLAAPDQPWRVLDVGCGNGLLLPFVSSAAARPVSYRGIDVSPRMVELARRSHGRPGASFECESFATASANGRQYDAICFNGSLQFFKSVAATLEQASRRSLPY